MHLRCFAYFDDEDQEAMRVDVNGKVVIFTRKTAQQDVQLNQNNDLPNYEPENS